MLLQALVTFAVEAPEAEPNKTLFYICGGLLAVWADDRDGDGYELYARMFDAQLTPLSPESRVTHAPRDSVYPVATLGPEGDVGILFRDQREGSWAVRFTRLRCAIPR